MKVSVCVATYRRPARLARLLEALAAQEPPPGGFEVVVADDGSPPGDGVTEVLEKARAGFPVPLGWATLPGNRGRAAARNEAWRRARGEWVAFTDDDCRPSPTWLAALVAAAAGEVSVVQGRTEPDPDGAHLLDHPLARSLRIAGWTGRYETANIAYRRSLLEDLGGFDPALAGSGEDTDLGWRAAAAGAAGAFAADAVVFHDVVVRDWRADLADRRRWGDLPALVRRHPGVRGLAWKPYVLRRSHLAPLVAVAAAPALATRTGRAAWLAAAAVAAARQPFRPGGVAGAVPRVQRRVGDAYEVAVMARGSLRHGRLLL